MPSRRVALSVAAVGLSVDLLIAFTTFLPGAPLLPQWPQFVVFPFIFVVHFRSAMLLAHRSSHFQELWDSIPRLHRSAFGAFLVAAWAIAMVSIMQAGGNPEQHGSRYFLDDHGTLVPVTHAAYEHALIVQTRIFSLMPAVFFAFGIIVNAYRAGAATPTPAPST